MKYVIAAIGLILLAGGSLWGETSPNAGKLLITEVAFRESDDWVEIFVVDGSVDWSGYRLFVGSQRKASIPSGWNLAAGDYVIVHAGSGQDDVHKGENTPGCWDLYGMGGLIATDNVIQIKEPSGSDARVDAVIWSNNNGSFTSSRSEANGAVADGMWDRGSDFSSGDSDAWTDSDDVTGGESIVRYLDESGNYVDTDGRADWGISESPSPGSVNDLSLPVSLSSFSGFWNGSEICLEWVTESEVANLGFHLYRSSGDGGDFVKITPGAIRGAGCSSMPSRYSFSDRVPRPGVIYFYKLVAVGFDGTVQQFGPIEVLSGMPSGHIGHPGELYGYRLLQNRPNPFNPRTTIELAVSPSADRIPVSLKIYDSRGRAVRTVLDGGRLSAGVHRFVWNSEDDRGRDVGSGAYMCVLRAGDILESRRMFLVK